MSSSSDPRQTFDSYEPNQELESPFLNEEYLADEARIAQWRVPAPGIQLESPFLEAFEDGWRSGEVEKFHYESDEEFEEEEAISDYPVHELEESETKEFSEFHYELDEEEFEEEAISDYHNPEVEAFDTKPFRKKGSIMPPTPNPQPHEYADVAREILKKRKKKSLGIVMSVVQLSSADGKEMIDTQTEWGRFRRRLKNPPAHVVMPSEVYEITWNKIKLQYVWILSNWKSTFPVGGVLFLPFKGSVTLHLVTFNVGALEDGCTNVHHAEMQAVRWIEEQLRTWRSRVGDINIWNLSTKSGLGYSPCNYCCEDLAKFLTNLRLLQYNRRASITWLTLYDKNNACGHPTNLDNLMKLRASGWECNNSPGCPQGKVLPTTLPKNNACGYPTVIANLSKELDDEKFYDFEPELDLSESSDRKLDKQFEERLLDDLAAGESLDLEEVDREFNLTSEWETIEQYEGEEFTQFENEGLIELQSPKEAGKYLRTTEEPTQPLKYRLTSAATRFNRVAALVNEGLKTAKGAIPQLSTNEQRELLRFMSLQLEVFFPRGYGLIDGQGKVLRQSKVGKVEIPVITKDHSKWPFEHRCSLYLSDQIGDRPSGDHSAMQFSRIRLFTRKLLNATPSLAVLVALHEMTHMMFAMIRRFERRFGEETVSHLLSQQPWRLLVLSGFAAHRNRLEQHLLNLLHVLPVQMQAAELARSLVEEVFTAVFISIVDAAIARSSHAKRGKRGSAVLMPTTEDFSSKKFIQYYVLERGFDVTEKQLNSQQAQQIFERMTSDVKALAVALRAHLDG